MNNNDRQIFCIRGHMKSGTNWACRLLNLHPEIHSTGEFHWQKYIHTYNENRKIFASLDNIAKESGTIRKEIERMARRSMLALADPAARLVGDRTPTTLHPVVFKNSPHISMVRDIRDIVVSKAFHFLNSPAVLNNFSFDSELRDHKPSFDADPWFFQKHPEKLLASEKFVRDTCRRWKKAVQADEKTAEAHKSIRVLFVHYEHLHEDLDGVLNHMFQFLGVDASLVGRIPNHLRPGHRAENPNQFNRKGQVGDWRNYMTANAKKWINQECGSKLVELGYADSMNWSFDDIARPKTNAA